MAKAATPAAGQAPAAPAPAAAAPAVPATPAVPVASVPPAAPAKSAVPAPAAPAAPAGDGTPPPAAAAPAAGTPAAPAAPLEGTTDGAPETYALTVPEGAEDYLDADDVTQIETLARAKQWTNEEAQAAIEEHADHLAAQSAAFRATTEADTTYGGAHLVETQRLAARVMDRFAPASDPLGADLRRDLAKSGYGNKLSIVAFLAKIGKTMAEDAPDRGAQGSTPTDERSIEDVLYPSTSRTE
mgnify:CR=1 FL=1